MPERFATSLAKMERTLICEGGLLWRGVLFHARKLSVEELAWPADLPQLSPELATWFAWKKGDGGTFETNDEYRNARWSEDVWRACADNPAFPRALVPVMPGTFVDTRDASVWHTAVDDDFFESYAPSGTFSSFADVLDAKEAYYASLRASPWRSLRLDSAGAHLEPCADVPTAAALEALGKGASILAIFAGGRFRHGVAFVKLDDARWIETSLIVKAPFDAYTLDSALHSLRFRQTHDDLHVATTADIVDALTSQKSKYGAKGPWEVAVTHLQVWHQPSTATLLERLAAFARERAPSLHGTLLPGASAAEIEALEAELGSALPPDLRALWQFADGQSGGSIFWNQTITSVHDARATRKRMMNLGAIQFGPNYWDAGLVPFLARGNGDHTCVDVAGAYGPAGSVLDFNHEQPGAREILFENVQQWLEHLVEALESGVLLVREDEGVYPEGFLETGEDLRARMHAKVRTLGAYPWTAPVELRDD